MDVEAQLIRAENWHELRRHYSLKAGHAWEEAWLNYARLNDKTAAVKAFRAALRDPSFEEAASIMLWRLEGSPPPSARSLPLSLKLYQAYQEGEFRPFLSYLLSPEGDWACASAILSRVLESRKNLQADDLQLLPQNQLSPTGAYFLGEIYNRRVKDPHQAMKLYGQFLKDLWVGRVLTESRRSLLDRDMSRRLRHAYAQKDGQSLKRLHRALGAKTKKLKIAPIWKKAFEAGLRVETESLTENLMGCAFWRETEWSPRALYAMRTIAFPEEWKEPPFVEPWRNFLQSTDASVLPPLTLEPDRLSLWQIVVELSPQKLSEALLRFPTEERFLFLWSVKQHREGNQSERLWPADAKESQVVRKNLERAFERSSNKVLWFDRLRSCGCSQSFYEFALSQIEVPIPWVLEDIKGSRLQPSAAVRDYLKSKLAVAAPNETASHRLEPAQIIECLSVLTPAETQYVLLSRYVLVDVPPEIFSDEILDLFWDAQGQVGAEVFERWMRSALDFIETKQRETWSRRHWQWIEEAWTRDPESLKRFSPQLQDREAFPWQAYLQAAAHHQLNLLILTCIPQIPDERQRSLWIEYLIRHAPEPRLQKFIAQIRDESLRAELEVRWQEERGSPTDLFLALQGQLEATAILNQKPQIYRRLVDLLKSLSEEQQLSQMESLQTWLEDLQALGACDAKFLRDMVAIADHVGDWGQSWRWTLQEWHFSNDAEKLMMLDRFLDSALRSRSIEEAQRMLIDQLFQSSQTSHLSREILDRLIDPQSNFRVKHLRREFIEKASRIFPLHESILKVRAGFDYRAHLLWKAIYGEDLEQGVSAPEWKKRKAHSFWGLIQVKTQPETVKAFVRYLNSLPVKLGTSEAHPQLSRAQKAFQKWAKQFRVKGKFGVSLNSKLKTPFCLHLESRVLELQTQFFNELDESMFAAMLTGFLQILVDRDKGLYEEASLIERYFQGMLLAGAPIEKLLRLCTWMAIHEKLISPQALEVEPQDLVAQLPFLNQLLIFYLSEDFDRKRVEDGIPLC